MNSESKTDIILHTLLDYINSNPRDLTYIGIGSCPHVSLDKLDDKSDQVMPKFITDVIKNTNKTIRIINFDPMFASKINFLHSYFNSNRWQFDPTINFVYDHSDQFHIWRSTDHRIEIFMIDDVFNHKYYHQFGWYAHFANGRN